MILDAPSSPTVIIMLTQTVESNREKCYQYFPSPSSSPSSPSSSPAVLSIADPSFTGTVTLLSHRSDVPSKSEIRELLVRSSAPEGGIREKRVWHLLYSAWPDFLVPEGDDREALLALVRLSHRLAGEDEAGRVEERVVHCSAGVGRSGTFIALDWLMEELEAGALDEVDAGEGKKRRKDEKLSSSDEDGSEEEGDTEGEDPIVDLVDLLRQQRMMMVQGEMQFGYLYEVMAELWMQRWKASNEAS
jgi:protein-tyrosine phosphatase